MKPSQPSLLRIVTGRIVLFGLLAMTIEVAIVFAEYWFDDQDLGRKLIELETSELAAGLSEEEGRIAFEMPAGLAARYRAGTAVERPDGFASGYYARVRTLDGAVLYSNCGSDCTDHLLPLSVNPPDFWQRSIAIGKPLSLVGGRLIAVEGRPVAIEIAIVRDPDGMVMSVIRHETFDHMVVPMTLMLGLVFGATTWSIRSAIKPVRRAADQADRLDPHGSGSHISLEGMPREVAHLAAAVNRAFARVGELMRAQKLFTSAIAHEIRTPAAIIRLELEHLDDPRARKAIADLDGLTRILEQLTALARLDVVDREAFRQVDLAGLASDVVTATAPYVFDRGKSIAFVDDGTVPVRAEPSLVENLIRNLVENAVQHTPLATAITVTAGPGRRLTVSDAAASPASASPVQGDRTGTAQPSSGLGIGRRIVERIADIHGATVETSSVPGAGTTVTIVFPADAPQAESAGRGPAAGDKGPAARTPAA